MKIRSFLAFDISEEMRTELASLIEILVGKAQGIKWLKPDLLHCTLKFFGDVEEDLLMGDISRIIEDALKHQAPLKLHGSGLGVFPNWRYPRIIWAGLTGDTEAANNLFTRIDAALERFHIQRDNRRNFRLHLTLGRVKARLKDPAPLMSFVEKQIARSYGDITVNELVLYKSVLTKEGPIYTPLRKFAFGQST